MKIETICEQISTCLRCSLGVNNPLPTLPIVGEKTKTIFLGEAPGASEAQVGRPFVGRSGKLLQQTLAKVGFTRDTVYITNAVKHRPPDNRQPTSEEITACREHLINEISYVLPEVICCLGKTASIAMAQILDYKQLPKTNLRAHSYTHGGILIVHTWHPAYVLRNPAALPQLEEDLLAIYNKVK